MAAPKYVTELRAAHAVIEENMTTFVTKSDLSAMETRMSNLIAARNVETEQQPIWALLGYPDEAAWDLTPEIIRTSLIASYETESGLVIPTPDFPSPDPSNVLIVTGNGPIQLPLYNLGDTLGLNGTQTQKCRQINNLIDVNGNIYPGKSVIVNPRFVSVWHQVICPKNRMDWDSPAVMDAYWKRFKLGERGMATPDSFNPVTRKRHYYRKSFVKPGNKQPVGKFDGLIVCFHKDKSLGGGKERVTIAHLDPIRT